MTTGQGGRVGGDVGGDVGGGRGEEGVRGVGGGHRAGLLYRCALLAFPPDFRRRHGSEMVEVHAIQRVRSSAGGNAHRATFLARSLLDLVRQGLRERLRSGRPLPGHGAPTPPRGGPPFAGLGTDVRLAFRAMRRSPGFTTAAIVVLAIGIGANATVFSALRAVVLAPPPYPEAERLVVADLTVRRGAGGSFEPLSWSFPKYEALLEVTGRAVDPAVAYAGRAATLTGAGDPEMVNLETVAPGYFELLGRTPVLGRGFAPDELRAGSEPVAVMSWSMWQGRYGGDPDMVGRPITLNGHDLRVVGVAPRGFEGLTGGATLWIPMGATATVFAPFMLESSGTHWFYVIGRLAPGRSFEEARAEMASIGDGIETLFPPTDASRAFSGSARTLAEVRSNEGARSAVILLSVAASLVLLVACANLSALLLARARRRARDGAVRVAVGASRWRLVRAALVESLVLSVSGGVVGVGVAFAGTRAMAAAWPARFASGSGGDVRVFDPGALGVDPGVLGFSLAITLATALLVGVIPALRASRADVGVALKDGAGGSRRRTVLLGLDGRAVLVGAQVALALVLLVGAGLVGGSTLRLLEVDEGFRTGHLLTFNYTIPTSNSRIDDPLPFHDGFLEAVRRIDGVSGATYGCAPLRGHCIITRVDAIRGGPDIAPGEGLEIGVGMVDDEHFDVLGIPLAEGRTFDARDGTDGLPTVVINEFAARRLFPDGGALGSFVQLGIRGEGMDAMAEVVGIVGDVLYGRPDAGVMAEAYYSYRDYPEGYANVTVRTDGDPLSYVPVLRSTLASLDPTLALFRVETMDEIVTRSVGDRSTTLSLLALFALVAVALAATGTWGIVAYSVADRRRELGLRLALGAGRAGVVGPVLREGVYAAVAGITVGIGLGLASSRLLEAMLWETSPTDPRVYAGGAVLILFVVLAAGWLPARHAARVDPVKALRSE